MSNLLTRKQFAALIKKQPNYVGMYISRKKIIEVDKRIDTDHPTNRAFIAKHSGVIEEKQTTESSDNKSDGKINQGNIDYIVQQHNLQLKATKLASDKFELDKKKGKVVPTDFMIEIMPFYVKSNINGIIKSGDDLIDELIDELEGDYELKLKYKKQFRSMVNETFKNNHESNTLEIIKKAKDYAINRNW